MRWAARIALVPTSYLEASRLLPIATRRQYVAFVAAQPTAIATGDAVIKRTASPDEKRVLRQRCWQANPRPSTPRWQTLLGTAPLASGRCCQTCRVIIVAEEGEL